MEFVQGRELKDYFEANERFAPADIVRIMTQILDALGYSHKLGVIHRDIKPANVILLDGRRRQGRRLRHRAHRVVEHDAGGHGARHAELHVARADHGPARRRPLGSLLRRRDPVPVPDRRAPVQPARRPPRCTRCWRKIRCRRRASTCRCRARWMPSCARRWRSVPTSATRPPRSSRPRCAPPPATSSPHRPTRRCCRARSDAPRAAGCDAHAADRAGRRRRGRRRARRVDEDVAAPAKKPQTTAIAIVAAVAVLALGAVAVDADPAPGGRRRESRAGAGAAPTAAAAPPRRHRPLPAPPAAARRGAEDRSRHGHGLRGRPGRSQRSALRHRQGAAAVRPARRRQGPARREGARAHGRARFAREELRRSSATSCSRRAATTSPPSCAESAPRLGKDGLMSMTTQAVVNVRALQKSLNQMSRDERIEFIRASGDPKISVRIAVRDADQPNAPPQPSPVAENLLKERIKSFGFRTWSEDGNPADPKTGRRLRRAGRSAGQEAVGAARGLGRRRHQVHADVVDGEVHRSRHRRGDLLQHDAAEGRRQLGERRRGDEGDRREDRRRVLAQLLPAARHGDRPQGRAAWSTGCPTPAPTTCCCAS